MRRRFLLLAVWLSVACGRTGLLVPAPPDEGSPDAAVGSRPDAAPPAMDGGIGPGDVRGQVVAHYTTDSGVVDRPVDLRSIEIEAFSELSQGGFARIAGSGAADGSFVVPNVPPAPFLLRIDRTVLVHPARTLTLPVYIAGRPQAAAAAELDATLDVDGLAPWQWSPAPPYPLVIVSSNAGCEAVAVAANLSPRPATGATSLRGVTAPFFTNVAIDAKQGDQATLCQFEQYTAVDGSAVQRLVRTLDLPSPELGPGGGISGTMQPVPTQDTLTVNWDTAAFDAYAPLLAPGTPASSFTVSVSAGPTPPPALAPTLPFLTRSRLSALSVPLVQSASTSASITFNFGSPFPTWSTWVSLWFLVQGAGQLGRFAPLADLGPGPIAPRLSPAVNVRIDGRDALAGAGTVSASPKVTWTPSAWLDPSITQGTIVYDLSLQAGAYSSRYDFITSDPRVVVPAELLTPGATYVAYLDTTAVAGPDPTSAAFDAAYVVTAPFIIP